MTDTGPPAPSRRPFLTATWRDLVMLTWAVPAADLAPYLADGTELDLWQGSALASIVAFDFRDTRVLGIPIPWHIRFPEVNLRFYVKRQVGSTWRRGVIFVQEMVPRLAIATVARTVYGEPYVARRMRRTVGPHASLATVSPEQPQSIAFEWRHDGRWEGVHARVEHTPEPMKPGSVEEFIAEHYWGYTRRPGKPTLEYEVTHPRWHVSIPTSWRVDADLPRLYGPTLATSLRADPVSTFVADGSAVAVYPGVPLRG